MSHMRMIVLQDGLFLADVPLPEGMWRGDAIVWWHQRIDAMMPPNFKCNIIHENLLTWVDGRPNDASYNMVAFFYEREDDPAKVDAV